MEHDEAIRPVAYPIPRDWRGHPELIPALRVLVEGAKRVALASSPQHQWKPAKSQS